MNKAISISVSSRRIHSLTIAITLFICLHFFAAIAVAQNGLVTGTVLDIDSGKPVAFVQVQSAGKLALTDINGRFFLERIPYGQHTLTAELQGYSEFETTVEVASPEIVLDYILLQFILAPGDQIHLVNQQKKYAQLYSGRLQSLTIGHGTVSEDAIRSGDLNLARALYRMPGVQVGRMGEINLRGAGRNRFGLQMDGLPLAPTSFNGRMIDPAILPVTLIGQIETVYTPTPDMDQTGLGGVIRLQSWQPAGNREIQVNAGGIALSDYSLLAGLGQVFSLSYSERFNPAFSMSAHVVHQTETDGFESLGITYGARDFGTGYVDVIERVSPGINSEIRSRLAGRLQFNYQPDACNRYYISGIYGNEKQERQRHRNIYNANNDWIDQVTTGSAGLRGTFSYNPLLVRQGTSYAIYQAGSEHRLQHMLLTFNAGMSSSVREFNQFDFLFSRDRLNYEVNMDSRLRPEMEITNIRLLDDGTVDQRSMVFNNVNRYRNDQFETRYSARFDLQTQLGLFGLKTGASALLSNAERRYEEGTLSTLRTYHQIRFQKVPRSNFDVFDTYYFPDIIDAGLAARYVDTSRPDMRLTEDDLLRRSLTSNYDVREHIYAGYLMTSLALGKADITGGFRVELTDAEYTGRKVLFNQFRFFDSSRDTSKTVDYVDFFPFANLSFAISPATRVQATISRSIQRQGHDILAPYELVLSADTLRIKGNPDLKPLIAENLDFMVEHNLSSIGIISAGVFYKRLSNLPIATEKRANETTFPFLNPNLPVGISVREQSFSNSDDYIGLMGFTVNWSQNLQFLPGFLHRTHIAANYSWTHTDTNGERSAENMYLHHVSPHVVNAALMYSQGRMTGQVSWHHTAPSLFRRSTQTQWAPSINPAEMVYVDQYEDGWSDVSLHLSLRISDRFRLWANVQNLFSGDRQLYGDNRDTYAFDTVRNNSFKVLTGIQFTY